MKAKKHVVTGFFYVAAIIQLTSCENQGVNLIEDESSITESFQKIETSIRSAVKRLRGKILGTNAKHKHPRIMFLR